MLSRSHAGEVVSVDGTHLGHNLPDGSGNRYCIDLVSVAGLPLDGETPSTMFGGMTKTSDECDKEVPVESGRVRPRSRWNWMLCGTCGAAPPTV